MDKHFLFRGIKQAQQFVRPSKARSILFVAGQQRSGTNMIMRALDHHWQTDVYHESDPRAFSKYQMRDLDTIKSLLQRSHASHVVVKALCESQRLSGLLDSFERMEAKAIWPVRHYRDVAASMARLYRKNADVLRKMQLAPEAGGWRGERMSASTKSLLDELINEDTDEVSAGAMQWYFRNILLFEQGLERDPRVLVISYEKLTEQPAQMMRTTAEFSGLPVSSAMHKGIKRANGERQMDQPIDPGIEELCLNLYDRLSKLVDDRST